MFLVVFVQTLFVCIYIYICIYQGLPVIWVQVRSRPAGADHGQTMREAQVLPPLTFLYRVANLER